MPNAVFKLQAMSLDLPIVANHPNRLPFSGTLTRVGIVSDVAPNGSGGRRVLITAEAAERAIPSLLGMAVNINAGMDGHSPLEKVGLLTDAEVVGDELVVKGFIYSSDSPEAAVKILRDQAKLGFSFEARNISVESADADPLVITDLFFTGASIMIAQRAAFKTTRLAAMAAMAAIEKENDDMTPEELKASLTEVVAGALAPVTARLDAMQVAQTDLQSKVGAFSTQFEAQAALVAKVDPVASSLEKTAAAMEAAGVGTDEAGQAGVLRRMAAAMRADAAAGRVPAPYQMPVAGTPGVAIKPVEMPKFEDSDAYKTLQASLATMTTQLAAAADKQAATETKLADMKATTDLAKPAPDRKTLPPHIGHLMAKSGLEMPEQGKTMSLAAVDAAMKGANMTIDQRANLKNGLFRMGVLPLNSNPAV